MGLISTRMKVDLYQINTVYPLNLISYVKQKNNFRYKTCFKLLILESIKTLLISLISLIFHRVFYPWRNLESFVWSRGEAARICLEVERGLGKGRSSRPASSKLFHKGLHSATTIEPRPYNAKATQTIFQGGVPIKLSLWMLKFEFHIFMCHEIVILFWVLVTIENIKAILSSWATLK